MAVDEQVKSMAAKRKTPYYAHQTNGFGVPATLAPHHFVVSIPRGSRQPVRVVEDLGMNSGMSENLDSDALVIDRVIIERRAWTEINGPVKRAFNERLKAHELAASRWKVGDNPVDRLLGKELCVLAWAIEDLPFESLSVAVRNWLALRPEERWWLFGMTATTAGRLDDRGHGWRAALRHALGERPEASMEQARKSARPPQGQDNGPNLALFTDE